MRGIKTLTGLRILAAGHAFVQNLRHGNYEIATNDASPAADSLSYPLSSPRQCDPPARTIRLPGHARRSDNASASPGDPATLACATTEQCNPLRRLVEVWGEPRAPSCVRAGYWAVGGRSGRCPSVVRGERSWLVVRRRPVAVAAVRRAAHVEWWVFDV
jgi:hypothetical protein